MSEIKVNKISPATGTETTLGDASDKFIVPSGAELEVASGATITNAGTAVDFGGGGVLQFKQNVIKSHTSYTGHSSNYGVLPDQNVVITPTLNTSKILIQYVTQFSGATNCYSYQKIYRDIGGAGYAEVTGATGNTASGHKECAFSMQVLGAGNNDWKTRSMVFEYLDDPATTSAVTYQIYSRGDSNLQINCNPTGSGMQRTTTTFNAWELAVGVL